MIIYLDESKSDKKGLKVLLLDGGEPGTTEFTQLAMLEELLYRLRGEDDDDDPFLDDLFDFIGGSGLGGAIAILAVCLRMPITHITRFYLEFHKAMLSKPSWTVEPPDAESNARDIQPAFREILSKLLSPDQLEKLDKPLIQEGERKCGAFLCAVNTHTPTYPRLFTTYHPKMERHTNCTLIQALQIAFTDGVHLPAYSLGKPGEIFAGTAHRHAGVLFPCVNELYSLYGLTQPVACIVSCGVGVPSRFSNPISKQVCEACTYQADSWVKLTQDMACLFYRFQVPKDVVLPEGSHDLSALKIANYHYIIEGDVSDKIDNMVERMRSGAAGYDFPYMMNLYEKFVGNQRIYDYQHVDYVQMVQQWLSPKLFLFKSLESIRERREPETGKWFLETTEFQTWMNNDDPLFILQGIPGAGKTFFSQLMYETFMFKWHTVKHDNMYVLGYFIKFDGTSCLNDILCSFLAQSLIYEKDVPQQLRELFEMKRYPTEERAKALLQARLAQYKVVYIVLDALDEYLQTTQERKQLVYDLMALGTHIRIFITTRPEVGLNNFRGVAYTSYILQSAKQADLKPFLKGRLKRELRLGSTFQRNPAILDKIVNKIAPLCHNTFLLGNFHIDHIGKCRTAFDVEEALDELPSDRDTAFKESIDRLRMQDERDSRRALHAVMWAVYSRRQLHVFELLMAVACSSDKISGIPVEHAMVDADILMTFVNGLVVVFDAHVSLINKSAREYFQSAEDQVFSDGNWNMASGCLRYLTSDRSEDERYAQKSKEGDREAQLMLEKKQSWFAYCSENWGFHAIKAKDELTEAYTFFRSRSVYEASLDYLLVGWWAPHKEGFTPLHMCSYFGVVQLVKWLLSEESGADRSDVNVRNAMGATPLHCAAKMGNVDVVNILLGEEGVVPKAVDKGGQTPLNYAHEAGKSDIVRILEHWS